MFVELVCGPPGSGKTTYCEGKRQFLSVYDPTRPVILFNLDPANDSIFPYPCDVNITELIDHKAAMEEIHLGPNGTYLYCIDFIAENMDWVRTQLEKYTDMRVQEVTDEQERLRMESGGGGAPPPVRVPYVLIDCPGQVEFYLYSEPMSRLIRMLQKDLHSDVCVVHLADAAVATRDVPTYISTCLLSLSCMVDMELPHVNVLTKWDTLQSNSNNTDFDVEFSGGNSGFRRGRKQQQAAAKKKKEAAAATRTKRKGAAAVPLQRDSGLRGPRGEVIMEDLTPSPSLSSSSSDGESSKDNNAGLELDSEEMDRMDLEVGDEHEMFLRTSDFFESHMKRLWRMKDRGALRNLALVEEEGEGNDRTPIIKDSIQERDEDGVAIASSFSSAASPTTTTSLLRESAMPAAATTVGHQPKVVRQLHYSETKLFRLSEAIASVIDGYGLVGFEALDIHDQNMMVKLTQKIDNAMGNLFFA